MTIKYNTVTCKFIDKCFSSKLKTMNSEFIISCKFTTYLWQFLHFAEKQNCVVLTRVRTLNQMLKMLKEPQRKLWNAQFAHCTLGRRRAKTGQIFSPDIFTNHSLVGSLLVLYHIGYSVVLLQQDNVHFISNSTLLTRPNAHMSESD